MTKGYISNLGDSKAFLFRDNNLIQLSMDHTNEKALREYCVSKRKPVLTQYLGIHSSEMIIEPFCREFEFYGGDRYLVCSDGLTDMVSLHELRQVLSEAMMIEGAIATLQKWAFANGEKDNIMIILIEIK